MVSKDIGIRKSEFVAKTKFLSSDTGAYNQDYELQGNKVVKEVSHKCVYISLCLGQDRAPGMCVNISPDLQKTSCNL